MKYLIGFQLIWFYILISGCNPQGRTIESSDNKIFKTEEVNHPTRIGEKFITAFGDGDTLTVKSFCGESGVEYSTYEEALINSATKSIAIVNLEHSGLSQCKESNLVDNSSVKDIYSSLHDNYIVNQSLIKSIWSSIGNKNYEETNKMSITPDMIALETFREIEDSLNSYAKTSWKLNMRRLDKDVVRYSLFAYRPRYYNDPEFPPFLELEMMVDNSINPKKISSFELKLGSELNKERFNKIGINPKYIK